MNNLDDITTAIQFLGTTIAALVVLLLLFRLLELVLRRLARHHINSTDLDLIGRRAVVTSTIRPSRPGKITCRNTAGTDCVAAACSDHLVRRGQNVLVSAIEGDCLRVVPTDVEKPDRRPA